MGREAVVDHGPHRDRVAALAGGAVEARLDAWVTQHGEPIGRWRRVFGRLEPGRTPWAVLAYEADGGPTVRVLLGEPAAGEPLGPVEIARCTADPALPGLAPTLAALDRAEVVRYRPGNRCTVRGRCGGSVRYVKVLARATDDQTDARALWAAGLPFAVAEPRGWDPRRRASRWPGRRRRCARTRRPGPARTSTGWIWPASASIRSAPTRGSPGARAPAADRPRPPTVVPPDKGARCGHGQG